MSKTALITGASGGIGLELAKIHAAKGDNLILVARNIAALSLIKNHIETAYSVNVQIIAKDLSLPNAAQDIFDEVQSNNTKVYYLINNAGFGTYGNFIHTSWEKEAQMLQLNIITLTQLCKLFLKEMCTYKEGKILNIASVAAFQPGPLMSVYFASKAYVLHFSQAIAQEAKKYGVSVTALCPGATESGFHSIAEWENTKIIKGKKLPSAKSVAEYGYKAMIKGKITAIPGFKNYVLAYAAKYAPTKLTLRFVYYLLNNNSN